MSKRNFMCSGKKLVIMMIIPWAVIKEVKISPKYLNNIEERVHCSDIESDNFWLGLVWFLCLMLYQP